MKKPKRKQIRAFVEALRDVKRAEAMRTDAAKYGAHHRYLTGKAEVLDNVLRYMDDGVLPADAPAVAEAV